MFDPPAGERIGEVWFTDGADLPLLAKYIFTSEKLSVQVHPNDEQARARGLARGKSECWYILEAEPGATLGLGLTRAIDSEELRAAALDGSIEQLMDWRPVTRRRLRIRSVRHHPCDRRGHFPARVPAECGRDVPSLRLWPSARTASRRGHGGIQRSTLPR